MSELARFIKAQDSRADGFEVALAELRAGQKQRHWIWYIFPQLAGLGASRTARAYAIQSPSEASDYLREPTLRSRLLLITELVAQQLRRGVAVETLMAWSVDALKLVSSLTLFGETAKKLYTAERHEDYLRMAQLSAEILSIAATQGYPACAFTHKRLKGC